MEPSAAQGAYVLIQMYHRLMLHKQVFNVASNPSLSGHMLVTTWLVQNLNLIQYPIIIVFPCAQKGQRRAICHTLFNLLFMPWAFKLISKEFARSKNDK